MKNLAIFASGSGTNAENIIKYFENHEDISVNIVMTNKVDAFVIERAKKYSIDYLVFNRSDFYNSLSIVNILTQRNIDFVVLAGFLWLIPNILIEKYPRKIINIHPALLPDYGGKGMYGMKVHEAIIKNGESQSGISIHYVNENYDEGELIFQAKCSIDAGDTPDSLANKIHSLEYEYFPRVIEKVVLGNL
jgi:phosphoribosylglycinamide formyltransferase 1